MPRQQRLLSDAIEDYLRHRAARGLRPNTIKNDECWLRKFLTHTGNLYVRSIGPRHVDTFFADNGHWSQSSKNLIVTILKTFFAYCRRQRWLDRDADPAGDYRTQAVQKKEMLRVPVQEFAALLDSADHPRNRMLIALGLFLFLRQSEIKAIRIGDVDLVSSEILIRVIKKHDLEDVMRINEQLDRELRRYLTWYAETHGDLKNDWYLIPAKNSLHWKQGPDGRLVPDTDSPVVRLRPSCRVNNPERVIQDTLKKMGYPTYWQGCHTLRRSGARAFYDELCERKGDNFALEIVSAMLHHESLTQTQRYLGVLPTVRRRDRAVMEGPMFPVLDLDDATVVPLIREAPRGGG